VRNIHPIQYLPLNPKGRDFVIGDVHGAFDTVLTAMKQAAFDPANDRLITVGDLIDRGPGSHRVLQFLSQPYVHSVRGNHEDELLNLYASGPPDEDLLRFACRFNGLAWWIDVSKDTRSRILDALSRLPLVIELETSRGTAGFLHADVPRGMQWPTFKSALLSGNPDVERTCLWGRDRIKRRDMTGVEGIGRIFVGHTPHWNGVARYGNVIAVDTGAVFGQTGAHPDGHLSMLNAIIKTCSVTAERTTPHLLAEIKDFDLLPGIPYGQSSLNSIRP